MGKFCVRLACAVLPAAALGYLVRSGLVLVLSYLPALAVTMLVILVAELSLLSVFRLVDLRALFARFLCKKRKKSLANP